MSAGDDIFTGEYLVSLKGYKIPHKTAEKTIHFAINNPPPPGTEDKIDGTSSWTEDAKLLLNNEAESNVSPLALVNRSRHILPQILQSASQPPPPPPPEKNQQKIQQTAISKPTKRSYMMSSADRLPEELIKLFKPLCCDLCTAKLNSPSTARLHYESKNHEKKINHWLLGWSERTGEPVPKRQASTSKGPTGPNALHCDVCDLALTSLQHAKQHNMGRKHKNALAGRNKPGGSGYYDSNNKWIRTPKIEEDPTNRFFIGQTFLQQKQANNVETVIVPESVLKSAPPPPPPPIETFPEIKKKPTTKSNAIGSKNSFDITADDLKELTATDKVFVVKSPTKEEIAQLKELGQHKDLNASAAELNKYCQLCDISVTSEMHMRLHLVGAKHAKKLRQLALPPYSEVPHTISQCISDETNQHQSINSIEKRVNETAASTSSVDYSVFRTPSGQYYCQVCDLSVSSEITLSQHFASKRHMKTNKRK